MLRKYPVCVYRWMRIGKKKKKKHQNSDYIKIYFKNCIESFTHYIYLSMFQFSSVQFSHSVLSDSVTPWTTARQSSLSIANSWSLLNLMSIELRSSNHLFLFRPLLSCLQSFLASGSFPIVSSLHQGVWSIRVSASASVLPMNTQDWFPLG